MRDRIHNWRSDPSAFATVFFADPVRPGAEEEPQTKISAPPLKYVMATTWEITNAARHQVSEDRGRLRLCPLRAVIFGVRVVAVAVRWEEPGILHLQPRQPSVLFHVELVMLDEGLVVYDLPNP